MLTREQAACEPQQEALITYRVEESEKGSIVCTRVGSKKTAAVVCMSPVPDGEAEDALDEDHVMQSWSLPELQELLAAKGSSMEEIHLA